MVILRFRTNSEAKDLLKKLKKMHKFSKELIDCVEDKMEDEDDDDEDYRYEEEEHMERGSRTPSYRGRYRRSM